MKLGRMLRTSAVWMAYAGFLTAQVAQAAVPTVPSQGQAPVVRDIALQNGGVLQGQVMSTEGLALAGVDVYVGKQGQLVATVKTDDNGRFAVTELAAGVYHVQMGGTGAVCRLWAPNTAPPAALAGALFVVDQDVVRAQCEPECAPACPPAPCGNPVVNFLTNPWVLGGIVATAIIVPLALDDDDAS